MSPARRRLLFGLLALVFVAVLVVGVMLGLRRSSVHPVAQDRAGPVVLVPGFGGSQTGLRSLQQRLQQAGKDVTILTLPGNGTGDLGTQAKALDTLVGSTLKRTGASSVDVVGYSAGGVVARLWVRDDGGGSQARRVVTLGSPQHGTDAASLVGSTLPSACPTACQQLAPDSDLLTRLNAGDETPRGPVFVSIWTNRDEIVTPPDSARLAGATNIVVQDVCASSTIGHGDLPTDHVVQSMVLAELGTGTTRGFSSADCSALSS